MALSVGFIGLLARLKSEGYLPPHPKVMEIGAQQLTNGVIEEREALEALGRVFGAAPGVQFSRPAKSGIVHGSMEHLSPDAPMARDFYEWLGFEYRAIDIDGSPGSLDLDLNFDQAPRRHRGRYHLVTNFGTTEHVANQHNAFKLMHDLCVVGGVMVHDLPFHGYLNHGLVNYNPKFFWMLARSNGYETVTMDFSADQTPYDIPENIIEFVRKHQRVTHGTPFKTMDAGLFVALRKTFDIPFVSPLDVPTGTSAPNKAMKKRYSTIFDPQVFERARTQPRPTLRQRLAGLLRRSRFRRQP